MTQDLPTLSCSVYYKQMYGPLQQVSLPGSSLSPGGRTVRLRDLQCGTQYQVEKNVYSFLLVEYYFSFILLLKYLLYSTVHIDYILN